MPVSVKIILITMGALVVTGIAYSTINNNKIDSSIKANPKQGTAKIMELELIYAASISTAIAVSS